MKEPLDELLVQACAAQQRADLAALGTAGTSQCANAICARRCAAHRGGC